MLFAGLPVRMEFSAKDEIFFYYLFDMIFVFLLQFLGLRNAKMTRKYKMQNIYFGCICGCFD